MATPGAKPNIIAARTDPNQNSRPDPGAAAGTITELLPPDELSPEGKKLWAISGRRTSSCSLRWSSARQ
jgi:hypothetical protein